MTFVVIKHAASNLSERSKIFKFLENLKCKLVEENSLFAINLYIARLECVKTHWSNKMEHTLKLQAFDCICNKCAHRFTGTYFPDFEYGRRIFRTKGGKYRAVWIGFEDRFYDEFKGLMRKFIHSAMSPRDDAEIFNKIFGISCDPINGDPIDLTQRDICPRCGSDSVDAFEIVPMQTVPTVLPEIQHTLWSKKTSTEREDAIRSALEQTKS